MHVSNLTILLCLAAFTFEQVQTVAAGSPSLKRIRRDPHPGIVLGIAKRKLGLVNKLAQALKTPAQAAVSSSPSEIETTSGQNATPLGSTNSDSEVAQNLNILKTVVRELKAEIALMQKKQTLTKLTSSSTVSSKETSPTSKQETSGSPSTPTSKQETSGSPRTPTSKQETPGTPSPPTSKQETSGTPSTSTPSSNQQNSGQSATATVQQEATIPNTTLAGSGETSGQNATAATPLGETSTNGSPTALVPE